jgi:RpiR family carbohydrate utilization transcriptional regulator
VEAAAPDQRDVIERIATRLPYLNPALRRIGERILEDPAAAKGMTISELAVSSGVSESTVSRFVREIELDRYQTLRIGIAEALFVRSAPGVLAAAEPGYVYDGISRNDPTATIIAKIARSSAQTLRNTGVGLDVDAIDRAVDLIEAANVILFCAMGGSSIAAENGVMRFTRAGKKCLLFRDQSLQLMAATIAAEEDVLIGISDSGDSTPVIEAMARGRRQRAATIGITSMERSRLTEQSDVVLFTSNGQSTDKGLYGEGVTAKWSQILVIDVLYAAYAVRYFDETLIHLQDTYATAIKETRSR